ncbi:hypothetical protein [Thermoanaerobacter sp. YS13]|uniref:hypothetical protein n=1 Tax=Thermoanaerobacter sp. YS13 TaxID=1511746 RepID=UPI000690C8A1|nr:hypothetical protein [Thermoanaerobacter sp. YS13]
MEKSILFYLLLAVPLATSFLAFGIKPRRVVEAVHFAGISIEAFLSLQMVQYVIREERLFALGDMLYADSLVAILLLIIGVVGFLNGFYSIGHMRYDISRGEIVSGKIKLPEKGKDFSPVRLRKYPL